MDIAVLLTDKTMKPKEKTERLSEMLSLGQISTKELIEFASKAKDPDKATCIEALEFATKLKPETADSDCLEFVSNQLKSKSPRVKWESAKVIGNIANLFSDNLETATADLLENAKHEGTVVRWSSAYALGEIIKSNYMEKESLIEIVKSIAENEEKNSIKKIYFAALKKINSV